MVRRPGGVLLSAAVALATGVLASEADLYGVRVEGVTDGVYLAYRPDPLRYFVEGNCTIIVNERDVVVVDTGGAPLAARSVIAEIRKLTANPVRVVINTHWHDDHRLGNQEYLKAFPGVEIVSHPFTRERIVSGGLETPDEITPTFDSLRKRHADDTIRIREEGRPGTDQVVAYMERYTRVDSYARERAYREVVLTPPTTTLEGKLVLHRGPRAIEVSFMGHGDTAGDLVVYLPGERLLVTGDIVVSPIPYGFTARPSEWVRTLDRLASMDFEYLIPGHGEVQRDKSYIHKLRALVASVQTQVKAAVDAGLSLEQARQKVELARFEEQFAGTDPVRRYLFRRWIATPLPRRAYEEFRPSAPATN
ncbi:MAG TPA: MBL fold metallo-hydrolase [Vicinamibacteria bacterium]|nr:MBL fold metallo-hydrolase [Vicinamibacteria bacterium]